MVLRALKERLGKSLSFGRHTPEMVNEAVVHREGISVGNSWNRVHQIWGGKEENKDIGIT